jgi:hypothetical protein
VGAFVPAALVAQHNSNVRMFAFADMNDDLGRIAPPLAAETEIPARVIMLEQTVITTRPPTRAAPPARPDPIMVCAPPRALLFGSGEVRHCEFYAPPTPNRIPAS